MIDLEQTINIDKCTHCGKCLYKCPLYEKYLDQVFSPRGKIILLEHHINNNDIFVCSYCGQCLEQCPLNIDLPAHLLLEIWPKEFYKLQLEKEAILIIMKGKSIVWEKMTQKDINHDLLILKDAKSIITDAPLYYLFLKKLKTYKNMNYKLSFLHEKGTMELPSFMKGFAKKGDHYKEIFFYEK